MIEMPKEDHGIWIMSAMAIASFLTCLLCTLCHRKRKRQHHRQLGMHRNAAHYDSTTSASGLSSSRRNLQGGSLSGSVHGISTGSLRIPPAPLPPTSLPPPLPHICISGGIIDDMQDSNDEDDDLEDECHMNNNLNLEDDPDADDPFINTTNLHNINANHNNINHYMNVNSNISNKTNNNEFYQNSV